MTPLPNYPFLDKHEFRLICDQLAASFEERAIDPEDWQTVQCRTVNDECFLRVSRTTIASDTEQTNDRRESGDESQEILEEIDEEALPRHANRSLLQDDFNIEYDILLSPSYSVPVLYFSIRDSSNRLVTDSEIVYLLLVPEVYRSQMRDVGVMGGLSMANHPITEIPVFFIHPCQTADALREVAGGRNVSTGEYLLLWMGIIGGSVGLNTPLSLRVLQICG